MILGAVAAAIRRVQIMRIMPIMENCRRLGQFSSCLRWGTMN